MVLSLCPPCLNMDQLYWYDQADLVYIPFMERFALALPAFANYDVRGACEGSIGKWLDAMQQLPCCQVASAEPRLLLQAFR